MTTMVTAVDRNIGAGTTAGRPEAIFLFKMLKRGGESVETMRELIAPAHGDTGLVADYRKNVMHFFDSFVRAGKIVPAPAYPRERKPVKCGVTKNTLLRHCKFRKRLAR
jgi:hypothetical protein